MTTAHASAASVLHPSVKPLAFILATNDSLAERSFQGVTDGDLWKRPTPQSNPMLWISAIWSTRGRSCSRCLAAKPATRAFTPAVQTVADQISFLTMHDTYHVGQLVYVRKALGLPGVVG